MHTHFRFRHFLSGIPRKKSGFPFQHPWHVQRRCLVFSLRHIRYEGLRRATHALLFDYLPTRLLVTLASQPVSQSVSQSATNTQNGASPPYLVLYAKSTQHITKHTSDRQPQSSRYDDRNGVSYLLLIAEAEPKPHLCCILITFHFQHSDRFLNQNRTPPSASKQASQPGVSFSILHFRRALPRTRTRTLYPRVGSSARSVVRSSPISLIQRGHVRLGSVTSVTSVRGLLWVWAFVVSCVHRWQSLPPDGSDSFKYEFSHEMSELMMRLLCDESVGSGD